jgi:2-polyprenyl-3-methyl-5-hydroxy-6-metoxy-1,4-benzoquinol methylase
MPDDYPAEDTSYVAWKGWVTEQPFGELDGGEREYFESELRKVTRSGREIRNVLEVGYGNGSFLTYCRDQGWDAVGTELDPELVTAATNAGYRVFDSNHVQEFDDGSFDLIAFFDVLEHIPQDDIVGFLALLARKLRPGGCMLMRFPNADSWLGSPLQNGDPTHVTAIGYLKMTYFALQASLAIVSFTGAKRRGFKTSLPHGLYSLTVGPIVRLNAAIKRIVYFPFLPIVLWTSNVVCVVEHRHEGSTGAQPSMRP